jgi:sodium transport system permease protein
VSGTHDHAPAQRPPPRRAIVGAILRKDLVDVLRDRRTLATMFLVPLVVYPAMVVVTSEAALVEHASAEKATTPLHTVGPVPPAIRRALLADPNVVDLGPLSDEDTGAASTAAPLTTASTAAWARRLGPLLTDRQALALVFSSSASSSLVAEDPLRVLLVYDQTLRYAERHADRVERALDQAALGERRRRLDAIGVEPRRLVPWRVVRAETATPAQLGGLVLGASLPALVLVFMAIACFYPAVELMAGEKERGTLSTLLTAPVTAAEIVLGKYLAVATIGALAGLAHVTVLGLTLLRAAGGAPGGAALAFPEVGPGLVLALLAGAMGLASVTAGLTLLTSTFARSFRDANNLLTPVLMALLVPAIVLSLPSIELRPGTAALPLAGVLLWMKALLLGRGTAWDGLVALASTGTAALALVATSVRALDDERVRFSTEGRRSDARTLLFGAPEASLGTALTFVGLCFSASYFASTALGPLGVVPAILGVQLGCFLVPTLLFARWMRRPRLLGAAPTPRALAAGVLVGVSAPLAVGAPIAWAQAALFPGQAAALEALRGALGAELPLGIVVLLFAVLPGFVEELAFRGLVFGVLRERLGVGLSLALQAGLFALVHGSAFRVAPTLALGLVLGLLAARTRGLVAGMIAHAASNAVVLAVDRLQPALLESPGPAVLVAFAVFALGLTLSGARPSDDASR